MAQEHVDIADGERHEPKGADTALISTVYVSDGANSGNWRQQSCVLNVQMDDISTANSVWVVSPIAGTIETVYSVINGAISTGDAGITLEIAGTAVTDGAITIATAASGAGDVDSCTPSALNVVTAGQAIEIITDGVSVNTISAVFSLTIRASA